jgi:hypothetical protein
LNKILLPIKLSSAILILVLLFSCTRSVTYLNRKTDQVQGLDLVTRFYAAVKEKNLNKAFSLCYFGTDTALIRNEQIKIYTLLKNSSDILGDITSYTVKSNNTKVIETGSTKIGEYVIDVHVIRPKFDGKIRNTFHMALVKGSIKIIVFENFPVK